MTIPSTLSWIMLLDSLWSALSSCACSDDEKAGMLLACWSDAAGSECRANAFGGNAKFRCINCLSFSNTIYSGCSTMFLSLFLELSLEFGVVLFFTGDLLRYGVTGPSPIGLTGDYRSKLATC